MPAKSKIIKQLSSVILVRDKTGTAGSTTLTAAAAAGAGTLTVAAITNFAVGEMIRVGAGDEMELIQIHTSTAPTGTTITLQTTLAYAHASGEAVVEMTPFDLGDVTDGGVTVTWAGEVQDVPVSTKRLLFTTLTGFVDAQIEWTMPQFTIDNLLHATAMLLAKKLGAGTTADPFCVVDDGNSFSGQQDMCVVATGVTMDGSIVRVELWGCDADYTGIQFQLTRGVLAGVPMKFLASAGGAIYSSAFGGTVDVSIKPTKAKVWDALTEVGFFLAGGTGASTVASGGAAGANTVTLVSATGYTANDWVKFGSGETVEFHQVESVATNTLTLRSRFLRSQAVGTACAEVVQTALSGVSADGVRFALGGSIEKLRIAQKRLSVGVRPGGVQASIAFGMVEISLANFAYALGIPQSEVSGGRMRFNSNIGTATIEGIYLKGLTQDGQNVQLECWGNSLDLSSIATTLNNQGPAATIPLTAKPSSGFKLMQWT